MIEGRATARYVRTSAQKAGLVLDVIRGLDVDRAVSTLRYTRKRVARDVEKVLRSAIANAQQKEGAGDVERLFVRECFADQGPSMKRIRPQPMGRAFRIQKRTAHLTIAVEELPEPVAPVDSAEAPKPRRRRQKPVRRRRRKAKRAAGATPPSAVASRTEARPDAETGE